ncbi:hypothetical protein CYLTODRAFT_485951 [Cylindrobasidium torrendii FP15055 ss-10]|uniref:Ankyrin n=1 Tax=Cylindrobasidium torrendii FP15055 ss-10 TaxID=1314674 RepID=A0A0D7BRC2_9AGAR|nr:hypothetical protein CYLTODRAFT_485951 [Cylindrobasidium torrendii FP15055 ss-10]
MVLRAEIVSAFEFIGCTPDTPQDEANRAYKKLALQNHPDKNPSKDATAKFQELSAAWNTCLRHYEHPHMSEETPTFERGSSGGHSFHSDQDVPLDEELAREFFDFLFKQAFYGRGSYNAGKKFREQRAYTDGFVFVFRENFADQQERISRNKARQKRANEAFAKRQADFAEECRQEEAAAAKKKAEERRLDSIYTEARVTAFKAARTGNGAEVRRLVEAHDLCVTDPEKLPKRTAQSKKAPAAVPKHETLLHVAAGFCDVATVDFLYNRGANPSALTGADLTPFHVACFRGNAATAQYFLDLKPRPEGCHPSKAVSPANKDTPLMIAAKSVHRTVAIIQLLTKHAPVHTVKDAWNVFDGLQFDGQDVTEFKRVLESKVGFVPPDQFDENERLTPKQRKKLEREEKEKRKQQDELNRQKNEKKAQEKRIREQEEREKLEAIAAVERQLEQERLAEQARIRKLREEEEARQRRAREEELARQRKRQEEEAARQKRLLEEAEARKKAVEERKRAAAERQRLEVENKRREEERRARELQRQQEAAEASRRQKEADARAAEAKRIREEQEAESRRKQMAAAEQARRDAQLRAEIEAKVRLELGAQLRAEAEAKVRAEMEWAARQRLQEQQDAEKRTFDVAEGLAAQQEAKRALLKQKRKEKLQLKKEAKKTEIQSPAPTIVPTLPTVMTDIAAAAPAPTAQKSDRPCRWFQKGYCRFGKKCRDLHVPVEEPSQQPTPLTPSPPARIPAAASVTPTSSTVAPAPQAKRALKPCRYFAKGGCVRGDKCKWAHVQPEAPKQTAYLPSPTPSSPTMPVREEVQTAPLAEDELFPKIKLQAKQSYVATEPLSPPAENPPAKKKRPYFPKKARVAKAA